MSLRSSTLPLFFCSFGSNSAFWRWHMSINEAKWTFLLYPCASRITSLLPLTFYRNSMLEFSPASSIHRLWHRDKVAHQIGMCHGCESFSSNAIFMVFRLQRFCSLSRDSTIQSYIVLNSFSLPIFGSALVFTMLGCLLHGIAGATGLSNFLVSFLRSSV